MLCSNDDAEPRAQAASLDPLIHPSFLRPTAALDEDSRRDVLEQIIATKLQAPQAANPPGGMLEEGCVEEEHVKACCTIYETPMWWRWSLCSEGLVYAITPSRATRL